MRTVYNSKLKKEVVHIFPGEYYISSESEVISTLLGSCISVCLFDKISGLGGMNHFLLPEKALQSKNLKLDKKHIHDNFESTRYGITAMETLILEMQKKGALRNNLRAKIFGGGEIIFKNSNIESVGKKNIKFIKAYLKVEKIPIDAHNTGDLFARKILFDTKDNSILMEKIAIEKVAKEEKNYLDGLNKIKPSNEIIYF